MKQIHPSWIEPLQKIIQDHYQYLTNFCSSNDLRIVEASRFLRGIAVPEESFNQMCKALKCNPDDVQKPVKQE